MRPEKGNPAQRLREWRKGVWLHDDGSYTVWTDYYYLVVMAKDDNIYCGVSRVKYTNKGLASQQVIRVRKLPDQDLFSLNRVSLTNPDYSDFAIDENNFKPGGCTIVKDIIYSPITEIGSNYILLSHCDGDKEKIYSDGICMYISARCGEFRARRVEKFGMRLTHAHPES